MRHTKNICIPTINHSQKKLALKHLGGNIKYYNMFKNIGYTGDYYWFKP